MTPLQKNFPHAAAEARWYAHWKESGYFSAQPDSTKKPYTIVMPPPNVTGVLHMGHALNNTVQDVLIRRHKAAGYNTCWVPGTDHASIATEAKVVDMLKQKGIDKNDLSREEFLKYAWEWKDKYGGIILSQLEKLGCALDWNRTHFTMDEDYYKAVIRVFVQLYNEGHIYRGVKMINWDPSAQTALSDEEVIFKTTASKLCYVRYTLADVEGKKYDDSSGSGGAITIATVRPETILGDVAVCVHPDDERYKHLHGLYCLVPLINRRIPIITDEYIDPEFGTGVLKITPAHDINDFNIGQKHNLPVIDTLNPDGTLSKAAQLYVGMDRFAARKQIIHDLEEKGHMAKIEDYQNQVGHSERTNAVIEPRLSMQWWCRMETLAPPALQAVEDEEIKFYPAKYKNLYRHWMSNIRDWCISRQLWWGQRIPAWYDAEGKVYVAETEEEAMELFRKARSPQPPSRPSPGGGRGVRDGAYEAGGDIDENREEAEEFHGLHMADMAAYPALKEFALLHRTVPTAAEKLMWDLLRGNSTGFQFRRQHVLGKYIADFVSLPARLVIEIDGLIHQLPENQDADSIRTEWLNQMGFEILRLTNEEVLHAPQQALTTIKNHLKNQATTTIPERPFLTKNQATTPLPERPFPPRGKAGMGAAGEDGALHQDPDVLDTWFSSWLWPMEVFGWNADPHNADLQHFYPTTTLVTAPEIIFFWVARMAMAGYKFTGQRPFEQVYFTGIVRDKQGRKMSKSLGNSPDLLALIDQWGADAVRFSVMISSPAGNDLLYDEGTLEQGRNFCNKLWNAARLLQAWQERGLDAQAAPNDFPAQWMEARINAAAASLEQLFAQFRLSEALKQLYSLIWDDYCSWYLEWLKPAPDAHLAQQDHDTAIRLFDRLLELLHPFLPFVTEELYHGITARSEGADLINLPMMPAAEADAATLQEGAGLQRIITAIRDARAKNNIKPREAATLYVLSAGDALYKKHENLLMRHTGAQTIQYVAEPLPGLLSIVSGTDKLFLKTAVTQPDTAAQNAALTKELEYLKGFLVSVDKKLSNEKFVQNAKPEVLAAEQKKRADAEEKIKTLTESISLL